MSEFKREERYIVVKLKHLAGLQIAPLRNFLRENRVPTLDCVVVESDWPEYEKVWQSIERRMTGQPAVTAAEELEAVLHWRGKHTQAIRERGALQQLLNAKDERADVLEGLLLQTNELLYAIQGDPGAVPSSAIDAMRGEVFTALKPADGIKPSTCTWSEGGFSWHTGCGKEWQFTDGGLPAENGMRFCHSCGKTLVVEETGAETEKDDDWRMNPCKQGHRDVGAAGGVAACNECDEKIEAPTTQEAFERWNATHPKL